MSLLDTDSDMTPPDVIRLIKELRAARRAIRKMKAECNRFEEGYAIASSALKRIDETLKYYRSASWS